MSRCPRPAPRDKGPVAAFAGELRDLRDAVPGGAPAIKQIAQQSGVPLTTLYAALRGEQLPGSKALTALATAYGGDLAVWLRKRAALERAQSARRL